MEKVFDVVLYIILILISLLFLRKDRLKKNQNFNFSVLYFSFIVISCSRNIGSDFNAYQNIFENIDTIPIEPIFEWIIIALKNFGFGFRTFILVTTLIPLLLIYPIFKNSKDKFLSFFIFLVFEYLFNQASIIRGFWAGCFILYAIFLYSKNKKIISFPFFLVACFSHYSSIFILILFLLKKIKMKANYFILYLIFSIFLGLVIRGYISAFINIEINDNENIPLVIKKLVYYIVYRQQFGVVYQNILHEIIMNTIHILFFIGCAFVCLTYKCNDNTFLNNTYRLLYIATIFSAFFLSIGAIDLGIRILLLCSIGINLLYSSYIHTLNGYKKINVFYCSLIYLVIFNLSLISYFTAIFDIKSPLYIG
ncbi:EpsG family protein [Providencia manganoxydans]|uniref:EpsG family protein n=1 Tax=Providencia manganoxydans TaxID=2923283 RepID=UPI0034E3ADD1